jgi:DNA-binding MarR family transcriptional regulator
MVLVHLTKAGTRMAEKVRRTIHQAEAEWLGSLSEGERAQLTQLLGKVQKGLVQG